MSLFIPKKVNVGYQKRSDTYTGKLAYVIYWDEKGKLRKEKSWQSWRDSKIKAEEFKNVPTEGFVINKDVSRCNWSHFGSGRSYIRVYDPRGIEFEISPENFIGILMESDCLKRGLIGEFIYAWKGTELVLLPCVSENYTEATKHTERQHNSISVKNLKKGCSYTTKDNKQVIYLGRYGWHNWENNHQPHICKKAHIFWSENDFQVINVKKKLSYLNSDEPVQEFASLVSKFQKDRRSQGLKSIVVTLNPLKQLPTISRNANIWLHNCKLCNILQQADDEIINFSIYQVVNKYDYSYKQKSVQNKYTIIATSQINIKTYKITNIDKKKNNFYFYSHNNTLPQYTYQQVLNYFKKAIELTFVLESGSKYKVETLFPVRLLETKIEEV